MLLRNRSSDDSGDKTEIRGETIVETVYDVSKKSAGLSAVPRLSALSGNSGERHRVIGRFPGERECFASARCTRRSGAMHVEVSLYLATFFFEQHREEKPGTKQPPKTCKQSRTRTRPE